MNTPPTNPPTDPPEPSGRERSKANLAKGMTENQERGVDGKIRKKGGAVVYGEPAGDPNVPAELRAMRLVLTQPASDDKSEWEKTVRAFRDKKPEEFLAQKRELEKEFAASAPSGAPGGTPGLLDHVQPVLKELLAPEFEEYLFICQNLPEIRRLMEHRALWAEFLAGKAVRATAG